MDIEMGDEGVFNTTGSKLWKKVQLLFQTELKEQYAIMRQKYFTVENMMKYIVEEQIEQIPYKYFNIDMQTKYLNYGSSYLYALHGSGEHHIRKWLRERLIYCDTLFGYNVSTSDYITLRSSKLGEVHLDIQTYIPMYVRIKWRDTSDGSGYQIKRVGRGETVRFSFIMPTATDQEIIIYAGYYLKSLGDVSNLQPTSMLIANASRLTEITCHSPNLINTDLSECTKLQKIDLSDSSILGTGIGAQPILNIQNCKYLKYCNCMNTQLTAIYTMQQGGNLEELYFPETTQVIQVTNQTYLKVLGIPYGNKSLTNGHSIVKDSRYNNMDGTITTSRIENGSFRIDEYLKIKDNVEYSYLCDLKSKYNGARYIIPVFVFYDETYKLIDKYVGGANWYSGSTFPESKYSFTTPIGSAYMRYSIQFSWYGEWDLTGIGYTLDEISKNIYIMPKDEFSTDVQYCKNLATVQISNCNAVDYIQYPYYKDDPINFNSLKYVQNLTLTNSLDRLTTMSFQGFSKMKNVTLNSMSKLESLGFDDMLPTAETSTFKTLTISDCPLIDKVSFNVSSDDYKVEFSTGGKVNLGGLQSVKVIESNASIKKLDTLIVPVGLEELRFNIEYGNGINEIKNIWSSTTVHKDDGFEGIDFQDMDLKFIDMIGLSQVQNAINFNLSPTDSDPHLNTSRDGSLEKPWFRPEGTLNLNKYTGSMVGFLRGLDFSKLDIVVDVNRPQTDLTGLFEGAKFGLKTSTYDMQEPSGVIGNFIGSILKRFPNSNTWDKLLKDSNISDVSKVNFNTNNLSIKEMFRNTPITEDIDLPLNIVAVDECFRDCTKITSYKENWNKTFNSTITTENCYLNTGGDLDDVPVAWGGYGFTKEETLIIDYDTNLGGLTFQPSNYNNIGSSVIGQDTNWGDGVVNKAMTHTYTTHGIYRVKTKRMPKTSGYTGKHASFTTGIIEVYQIPTLANCIEMFKGCNNLKKVTAYNLAPTSCQGMFQNCTSLAEIIGMDTWDMSACSIYTQMFKNTAITDFSFITSWNMSKANELAGMFSNCKMTTLDLSNKRMNPYRIAEMLRECTNLETINLENTFIQGTNNPCGSAYQFNAFVYNCTNLQTNVFKILSDVGYRLYSISLGGCNSMQIGSTLNLGDYNIIETGEFGIGLENSTLIKEIINPYDNITTSMALRDNTNFETYNGCIYSNYDSYNWMYYGVPPKSTKFDFTFKGNSSNYTAENLNPVSNQYLAIGNKLGFSSIRWTVNSFVTLFNCLYDYSSNPNSRAVINIGSTNLEKLTDQQKAIAINKGWSLS